MTKRRVKKKLKSGNVIRLIICGEDATEVSKLIVAAIQTLNELDSTFPPKEIKITRPCGCSGS